MAHDFAKHRSSDTKPKKKRSSSKSATRVAQSRSPSPSFFSGLLVGLFAAFIFFFTLYRPGLLDSMNEAVFVQSTDSIEPNDNQDPDFTFYDRLSEAEVVVDVIGVDLEPEVEENPSIYRVQAASFNDIKDAESLKAEIILLGLDAAIYQAEVLGQTKYRVQAGPFIGNSQAEAAIELLAQNNVNGAIKIEVR